MIKDLMGFVLRAVVVLSGTALATFALLWHAPGDPAQAIAMARFDALLTEDVVDQVREEVGLNAGFWTAFRAWVGPLLTLDFGRSAVTGRAVWPGLAVVVSVLAINLAGDALRDAIADDGNQVTRPHREKSRFSLPMPSLRHIHRSR